MLDDNSFDVGQPDPNPFKILGAVGSLKDAEDSLALVCAEADAVVFNKENGFIRGRVAAYLDHWPRGLSGEFDGVVEQVLPNGSDKRRVAGDGG